MAEGTPETPEQKPEGMTVVEMNDGSFQAVKDSEVDAFLERVNAHIEGTQKHAIVYSRSGLTAEEVDETLKSLGQ
jgi:hypothetical protein